MCVQDEIFSRFAAADEDASVRRVSFSSGFDIKHDIKVRQYLHAKKEGSTKIVAVYSVLCVCVVCVRSFGRVPSCVCVQWVKIKPRSTEKLCIFPNSVRGRVKRNISGCCVET